ncbi:hypothetical protein K435DRAFT_272524 [Dendrothele bispora CBS 962.96]|uniref:Uncharacterized protein n=1 Tax=Dendrothele bispora (strain CBS 962.96) TaxID=1314807 RepID=A0A4S8LMS1_DENBC|nr:hypothetical protein K435DRAFT_272524 [Dendrothele bispora CBS 962.96]
MPSQLHKRSGPNWYDKISQYNLTPTIIWISFAGIATLGLLFLLIYLCRRSYRRRKAKREKTDLEAGMNKILDFSEKESKQMGSVVQLTLPSSTILPVGGRGAAVRSESGGLGVRTQADAEVRPNDNLNGQRRPDTTIPYSESDASYQTVHLPDVVSGSILLSPPQVHLHSGTTTSGHHHHHDGNS